ncbi:MULTISPECIES: hypothetical protein [Saccharopolyspora]|uniref:Uncharacterized protein n=1 Tax=Saccharopolyspora elongata TaxID=2530387 RepID=A0A4R4ZHG7_9PSEU|nr:hypothetical protein [Saccharopolyspora elongata]TDD56032.1 hypothetical protein E1288_02430 [Saccharopolyspora elongata]
MPKRANDQGESTKKRSLVAICTIVAVPIGLGAWLFPDVGKQLFGGFTSAPPGSSSPSLALKFTGKGGSCQGQMIDFDEVQGDRVSTALEPYDDVPAGTDLVWDTCDGAWNITGYRTEAKVARMGKDKQPSRDDCRHAVERAPNGVDWVYEPGSGSVESSSDGDLGAGSSFCIQTSGGSLVLLQVTHGPATNSVPVVETTVWNH